MPRAVNEDERHRVISDVVWRLAAEEGIPAVTFRRIAAELGTSTTVVTRTFRSRDYMLDEVFRLRVQQWITEMRAQVDRPGPAGRRLRGLLLVSCPVTESDLRDARVWVAAIGPPKSRPPWLARFGEFNREFYDLVTRVLQELRADPGLLHALVALVWGVNAAAVEDPVQWPGPRVRWTIDTTLSVLGLSENTGGKTAAGNLATTAGTPRRAANDASRVR